MEYIQINLKTICRTCKSEAWEMKPLYYRDPESGKEDPRLDVMLMACTSIQVNSEDGLPKLICRSCYEQLKNAYLFKTQCEKTDLFLKDYLKWLENQESTTGDVKFIDNLIGDNSTVDKTGSDSIKADSKTGNQNMDYIEVVDNNLTIYKCKTCSKVFYTLEGLSCHKKVHITKPFKCKQCHRSYTKLNLLQKHELSHEKRKKHLCNICNKTLPSQVHLKRHLMMHSKERPYSCPNCNCCFECSEHLHIHSKSCKGGKVHVCDICNKEFTNQDSMEIHRREHGTKQPALTTLDSINNIEGHSMKIEVDDITDVFSNVSDREDVDVAHETIEPDVEVSENNDEQKLNEIAEITKEVYIETDTSEILIEEVKIEEEMINDNKNGNAGEDELLDAVNGNHCGCDSSVYFESVLLKAALTKRGKGRLNNDKSDKPKGYPPLTHKISSETNPESTTYECPQCKLIFNELNIFERHAEQHGLKMYECETCLKKFSRSNNLKIHKESHLKTKRFSCAICRKRFSKQDLLKKHTNLHSSKNAFNCEICRMVFAKEESLKKHKICKHNIDDRTETTYKREKSTRAFTDGKVCDIYTKDEKFQCKICEKTFLSKSLLLNHLKIHKKGWKKILCTECGQRFGKHELVTHMRRHRGEKPFKCKFCGKGFPRTSDLVVHERYHTGEKTHLCVICGKGFGRAYNLTVHMRTHTGERPYCCTYCDAAFAQSYDLKKHVRRHTGERFKCDLCPSTFIMSYHLTQHKKMVHGLNITGNITRLQGATQLNMDESSLTTVPLPTPVEEIPDIKTDQLLINQDDM